MCFAASPNATAVHGSHRRATYSSSWGNALLQMVSAWKESGKLKDLKIEELNFQLRQAAAQLEAAKQEATALQQQLADSTAKVGTGQLHVPPCASPPQCMWPAMHPNLPGHQHQRAAL